MSTLTIGVDRVGAAALVRIAGDVTSGSEHDLTEGYTTAVDGGARAVILDFSGMEYMNSGGIGLLVTILVRAQRSGVKLLATGLSDHYRQILSLTRLDEAIAIHPDEAAALAAVGA
jgi:anti-sigma B factor antagonist